MRPPVGSFAWLLAHELKLNWRQFAAMFATSRPAVSGALGFSALAAIHALAFAALDWVRPIYHAAGPDGAPPLSLTIGLVCVLAWLTAQGLLGTSRALHDRGDLDLLLSSPLPPDHVFAARAVSLAANAFGSAAILILPVANVGAVFDTPAWLAVYPALGALSLVGASLGAMIAIGLFRLVGARRARIASSVTAAALAGSLVLSVQIAALLSKPTRDTLEAAFTDAASNGLLRLPADAIRGELLSLVVLTAIACGLFFAVVKLIGPAFAHAAGGAGADQISERTARRNARRTVRFQPGLGRSLRLKEWRLLLRDPNLFAQLSLQIIYTLPVAVVLIRNGNGSPSSLALAPVIVVIATQIAASLAWIVVSAEEAPELIAAAPVAQSDVDRAKLGAIALPVMLIISGPLVGLALISWWHAILTIIFAAAGAGSGALLNLWHPAPGKRRGMLRRHSQSKLVAMVEHLLALLWAVAIALAVVDSALTLLPIALVVGVLFACRRGWSSRRIEARSAAA